jgi:hypothetical protein
VEVSVVVRVLVRCSAVVLAVVVGVVVVVVVGVLPGQRAARAQEGGSVGYRPPVAAPVRDPFRAPATPYGPGNRGIEYDTRPGDVVRAAADGQVTFAGPVGASLHVTVAHADGVRTSYSQLHRVDVRAGQAVRRGDPVGRAGEVFHLGARRGGAYLDPATLFGPPARGGAGRGELLPLEVPPGGTPTDAPDVVLSGERGWDVDAADLTADLAAGAADVLAARIRLEQHYAVAANPVLRATLVSRSLAGRLASPPPCSDDPPPTRPVAGQERRAVLVGGLGSSSRSASVDHLRTGELGYAAEAVERFTYAAGGGPYTSPDTQGDLIVSAQRLAERVEHLARAHPGATIDLYGHSMGGVVTRLALVLLDRKDFDLGRLGVVTTLGTPHRGADLATAAAAADTGPTGDLGLDLAEELVATGLDPDGTALDQLAETSPVIEMLREAGVPPGVELVSIAASGDVVVPLPNTQVDGARNVTVSLAGRQAHGELVAADETTAEIARALAGGDPGCESPGEVVREHLLGHGISFLEDVAGFTALGATG